MRRATSRTFAGSYTFGGGAPMQVTPTVGSYTIRLDGHGLVTGDGPLTATTTGTLPAGSGLDSDRYAVPRDANHFDIADSYAHALAGTLVSITDAGVGVHTLVTGDAYSYEALTFSQAFTVTEATDTLNIAAHGLNTGDGPLQATNSGSVDALPDPLMAATDYYAAAVSGGVFKFSDTRAHALAGTNLVDLADAGVGTQTLVTGAATRETAIVFSEDFTTDFVGDPNALTFVSSHGLADGDGPFRLTTTGTLPDGLLTGTDYYVVATGLSPDQLALSDTYAHAIAGTNKATLIDDGTGTHTMSSTASTVNTADVSLISEAPLTFGDLTFSRAFGDTLTTGGAHGLLTGDGPVDVSTTDVLPAGLSPGDYWIIKSTASTLKFALSYADAVANTFVSLSDNGSGVHTIADKPETVRTTAVVDPTFTADAGTNEATIAITGGLASGDGPFTLTNSGSVDALPTGISALTDYYSIRTGDGTLKLATSRADAIAETAITIDDTGVGTHTLTATGSALHLTPVALGDSEFTAID